MAIKRNLKRETKYDQIAAHKDAERTNSVRAKIDIAQQNR